MLYGKGVWMLYSLHLDYAVEMAREIGATHLFYRTGHRGVFLPEAALRVERRARAVGLIPFAWLHAPTADPSDVVRLARRSIEFGYQAIVFDILPLPQRMVQKVEDLARQLTDAGFNPEVLYYSAPPAISRHPEIPYQQLSRLCRGGFMPKCPPLLGKPPEVAIHKLTYEEYHRWSQTWGYAPPLYPVLCSVADAERREPLSPAEFSRWVAALAEHRPTFFSLFHASATPRNLWPLLAEIEVPRPPQPTETSPLLEPLRSAAQPEMESPAEPEEPPLVVTVQVSDTVWTLCERYGCTREQFWEWNGYLWDERGWPRDANYLQPGWRVRVR